MARKTLEAESYGVRYRIHQMPAADAFAAFILGNHVDPLAKLVGTSIWEDGQWVALDNPGAIDRLVVDRSCIAQPRAVLNGLLALVLHVNCGFMVERKGVKVPSHLKSDSVAARRVDGVDPIMGTLIAADKATLIELETHYSLEDAFRIYDIFCNDQINKAEGQYQATQKAKGKV